MSALTVTNLTKTFTSGFWPFIKQTSYTAVNNISFNLQPGEILGFLGPNGSGKTTTIQMLLGTLTPTSGSITYFGEDINAHRSTVLKKVGYASGYERLPARLTITENLDCVGRIYGLDHEVRTKRIKELLSAFGLWEKRNIETGSLSAGQSTRVMLAKAFLAKPQIVLLDEPTAALDPDAAQDVRSFILEQNALKQTSILITSHNMDEVTTLCDRVLVIKNGSIIANNTPEQLAQPNSLVMVHLAITNGIDALNEYTTTNNLTTIQKNLTLTITISETMIAQLLMELAQRGVEYSHISIDKPTLEDYFLSIAK